MSTSLRTPCSRQDFFSFTSRIDNEKLIRRRIIGRKMSRQNNILLVFLRLALMQNVRTVDTGWSGYKDWV
jgi:hypothetical protein